MIDLAEPMLACGDLHGDQKSAARLIEHAAESNIRTILQVGDFGFWPLLPQGKEYLKSVSVLLVEHDITLWWADGNHEQHSQINHDAVEPIEVWPNLFYAPRGCAVRLGGRKVVFVGGAVSIDQDWGRVPGFDWFPEECYTQEQLDRAAGHGSADIVVSHETPKRGTLVGLPVDWITPRVLAQAEASRAPLRAVLDVLQPEVWLAGHWHERGTFQAEGTRVEVLGHNGGPFDEMVLVV